MPAVLLNQIDQRYPKSERDMSSLIHARSLDDGRKYKQGRWIIDCELSY